MVKEDQSLEVSGPFGIKARATGGELRWFVFILAVVGLIVWLGYIHHAESERSDRELIQNMNEMIYLLSLSQDERATLKISMPESLRRKIIESRTR